MIRSCARMVLLVAGLTVAGVLGVRALGARVAPAPAPSVFAPFGEPLPGIDAALRVRFERGRAVALRRFAPSEGLGPDYNATSCAGCHEKPVTGGGASRYRGVYVTAHAKKTFVVPFEHHFSADSVSRAPKGREHVTHAPSPFFGVGLLAEIPAEAILARADPSDRDGDGIRGRVNFERGFIGRFGRKAQMASLQGFVRLALLDHMGITSSPVSSPPGLVALEAPLELATADGDRAADPEIAPGDLSDLLAFVGLLAPPPPDPPTEETLAGRRWFEATGCTSCHVPALAGPRGPVPAYTDLLLHDMGPELADGVAVGQATGRDFRTQPLWGLAAGGPFLHDGSADTLDEAIRRHGGEGERARRAYEALPEASRAELLAFLGSLGGADRRPDGLLPRDAAPPPPGALGGPSAILAPDAAARFANGRVLFDRDFGRGAGLGPRFNGDACRSCHFDPVLGGSGPSDVDVVRHGLALPGGFFEPPEGGDTMASRFLDSGHRPLVDARANLFERRQTPPAFGLGLIDAIAEETIRSRADPEDRDGDGVRGVVSVVPDGRVGRFGWKAQLATLADFTDDAFRNEMGIVPERAGRGVTGTSGVELPRAAFDDVVFFLANLAPPPRAPMPPEREAEGRRLFAQHGCVSCHVPEMPTREGTPARLFSDLLLHDVAGEAERFVPQGAERAFRTPPLWGLRLSAPYFHDGLAETVDAAIRRHAGEATSSRERYVSAPAVERDRLLEYLGSL